MGRFDDDEVELADRGDDRPGLDDLDDVDVLVTGDDDDLDEDDLDEDYPEDATEEDIDLVVALYREEGQAVAQPLSKELANDLDELIVQLRRIPADAGALGMVSIASEVFVLVRVRGRKVQVLLSDVVAASDWPIARDVADFLGVEVPDEEDDDSATAGDLDILADLGIRDFELDSIGSDYDADSDELLEQIATKIGFGVEFKKTVKSAFDL